MYSRGTLVSGHLTKKRGVKDSDCNGENTPHTMPTQNNGKRRETTIDERVAIIKQHAEGFSYRQIAEKTNISKSQAQKIISSYLATGTILHQPRPGAPPKLDERDKRHIARLAEQYPEATCEEITVDSGLRVCSSTIGQALRTQGYYVQLA